MLVRVCLSNAFLFKSLSRKYFRAKLVEVHIKPMKGKLVINKRRSILQSAARYFYRLATKCFPSKLSLSQCVIDGTAYLVWLNEDIGRRLFLTRSFEREETEVLKSLVRRDDICLDVGGNIGYFAINFSKWCDKGKVYVVEPVLRNFLIIQLAGLINKRKNIIVSRLALGDNLGTAVMDIPDEDGAYAHVRTGEGENGEGEEVPMITLDDYLIQTNIRGIDVLKIDVEGAEAMVLAGAEKLFSDSASSPRLIMIELVNEYLGRYESSVGNVLNLLETYGYSPYYARSGGLVPFREGDIDRVFNVFFLKQ